MSSTKVEDFLARVDAELATLSDADAHDFLERLLDQWSGRYADFQFRVSAGHPVAGDAWDFTETIAALEQRGAKYVQAEIARYEEAARKTREFNATQDAMADMREWQRAHREAAE